MSLKVCETFVSIQGESTYMGLPCFFIRLSGCNLRCVYCDTTYAYEEGVFRTKEEIIREVEAAGLKLVEVTGGEPLLQEETPVLVKELCDRGYKVLVETNGSFNIEQIDSRAVRVVDIKTPGSGMLEKMEMGNLRRLNQKDEVKFVITSREDYLWAKELVLEYSLEQEKTLFSPAQGFLKPEELAEWIIDDRLYVRLNLQLHKCIFGDRRGV
jgi:7-carboxy-7-deazaguanine synthase